MDYNSEYKSFACDGSLVCAKQNNFYAQCVKPGQKRHIKPVAVIVCGVPLAAPCLDRFRACRRLSESLMLSCHCAPPMMVILISWPISCAAKKMRVIAEKRAVGETCYVMLPCR